MRIAAAVLSLSLPLSAIGCSSTSPPDAKSLTVLGRQSDVRVTAEIVADRGDFSSAVRVMCEVENLRPEPIEIALARSESSWDPDNRMYTVTVGSEVPVEDASQLVTLAPNEKRQFHVSAPLRGVRTAAPLRKLVRLKLYFLDRPVAAAKDLGADLWDLWAEAKQTVVTNAIPLGGGWSSSPADATRSMAR